MEIITIITLILLFSFSPVKTGLTAKDLRRKFWPWFFMGLFLPVISIIILLHLPARKLKQAKEFSFRKQKSKQ